MFEALEEEFDDSFSFEEMEESQDQYIEEQLTDEELDELEDINSEEEDEEYEESEEEFDEEGYDEEYDEDEEFDEPSFTPFIHTLEESGLLYLDPEKEYDDSVEGFQEVISDTVNARFTETLDGLSPTARRLLEVEMSGGDISEAFEVFNTFDYSEIDLSDTDVQREMVREYYQSINPRWSDERINRQIDMLDADEELYSEATDAQSFFMERDEKAQQEYLQQVQYEREQQEQAYWDELEEYETIIDSNDSLYGLPFENSFEKEQFKRYCFERGEDGKTQAERDDEDKVTRIAKEYYKFKGFNYSHVEKKAKTQAVIDLKKQLSHFGRKAPGTTRAQAPRKRDSAFDIGDLNLDV
jgi:hypothetical protein